jgi:AIPR protein
MSASSPDQVVIAALFDEYCTTEYPGEKPDDVFEKYAVTQVLKPRDLSTDELIAGIVDGTRDGGIDSFFVFLNGMLLSPDDPVLRAGDLSVGQLGQHPDLDIYLIQAKNTGHWEESTWEHLLSSLANLLDTGKDDLALEKLFRSDVVERTGILRKAIRSLGPTFPKVTFNAVYVTRAAEANLTDAITERGDQVVKLVRSLLTTGAQVTASHVGAGRLYELAGADHSKPGVLRFRSLIREQDSFLGVVALEDYLSFVRTEAGALREELFESNVRDYEGSNAVNEAIGLTLGTADNVEFWWLNNGVTVLGDRVDSPQQTLTISRPLIVNGLQTSYVLDRADQAGQLALARLKNGLVVRVVVSVDEDARDRIIAGTNRQTQVPGPALYATQPLQRDIERFLAVHGWYYERRKNRYRNLKKPAKQRITIGLLAQALITLKLGQPDVARARPSTLLAQKDGYSSVFPDNLDLNAYLVAIEVLKAVDEFLTTDKAKEVLDEFTNARFYVTAGYAILRLRLTKPENFRFEKNFSRLSRPLNEADLVAALEALLSTTKAFQKAHPKVSRDAVFKSSAFRDLYFGDLVTLVAARKSKKGEAARARR